MPEGVGGQPSAPGSGPGTARVIRTPDHRLRVFVSSTLRELVAERKAVRAAVESLHLSPVMFELGARPHPPQELYRAYLDQSHVFVGLYWESYGWVAPDSTISGLEDEYRLCGPKPKLIYVKTSDKGRQDRLEELLDRIRDDDTASYKSFDTAEELQRLVTDDLALMLTERFEATLGSAALPPAPSLPGPTVGPVLEPGPAATDGATTDPVVAPPADDEPERPAWPRVYTALVGRDRELAELSSLLGSPSCQLVTLLGPGGIGKTRLALALGGEAAERGSATYVGLASLTDPADVLPAVAEALGLPDSEDGDVVPALVGALRERTELVVLDNVEHVVEGVAGLGDVLEACPGVTVLATSRTPLRLTAEREYPVSALAAPRVGSDPAEVAAADGVRLFVERARTVRPRFELTADNADEVAELVRRLDGLPLALELAAARTRLLSPADLLRRLDRRFELLAGGPRDTPGRQQTLRSTIAWSVDQLRPAERRVLDALAVFERGCSLEAAEAVCATGAGPGVDEPVDEPVDVVEVLSVLVEDNLVVAYDLHDESRFTLLESIRAYAREVLEAGGQDDDVHERHAAYYRSLAEQARDQLTGAEQRTWLNRLEAEHDNLRAALQWFAARGDADALVSTASSLLYFWWIRGHGREGRQWLGRAAAAVDDTHPLRSVALGGLGTLTWLAGDYPAAREAYEASLAAARVTGDEAQIASALGNLGVIALELGELEHADALLEEALATNRRIGNRVQTSRTLINLSLVRIASDDFAGARTLLEESVAVNRELGDAWGLATALINLGDVHRAEGELDEAQACFAESMRLAQGIDDRECVAYALEGAGTVAAARGDARGAARLWGAAEGLREVIGTPRPPSTAADDIAGDIARVRDELGAEAFDAARAEGRETPLAQHVVLVTGAGTG